MATSRVETRYAMLVVSMVGFLVGIGFLYYGWPWRCEPSYIPSMPFFTNCGVSYWVDVYGVLIIAASVAGLLWSWPTLVVSLEWLGRSHD
jgi:hypothetical protein